MASKERGPDDKVSVVFFPKRRKTLSLASRARSLSGASLVGDPVTEKVEVPAGGSRPTPRTMPAVRPSRTKTPRAVRRVTPVTGTPGAPGSDPDDEFPRGAELKLLIATRKLASRIRLIKLKITREGGNPARVAALARFGHQLFEMGAHAEAREVFEILIELDPEDVYAHTMLGTVFLALEDPVRALALFEAAISISPDELPARVYRAEIRLKQGQHKAASEDLKRVTKVGRADDPFVIRAKKLLRSATEQAAKAKPVKR
jgi:hypothetical protein